MSNPFSKVGALFTGVSNTFSTALSYIKTGAQIYSALDDDDKLEKDSFMSPDFRQFRTRAARPALRNMEQPYGIRPPLYPENVQLAVEAMAQRQLQDTNLQRIRDYAAIKATSKYSPNINTSYDMDITPKGARAAQISRMRIRQTLGS